MENKEYYILKNKEKQGPFSLEEMRVFLDHNTLVWHKGLDKWTKASSLSELRDILMDQPPTASARKKRWIIALVLLFAVGGAVALGSNLLHSPRSKSPFKLKDSSYNNQQLYSMYAADVVLIQHKFIYEITAGSQKFYFNEIHYYDTSCYLTGLTQNRVNAETNAQPLQGTGFFITRDGKILTNRHVAFSDPGRSELTYIQNALLEELTSVADNQNQTLALKASISQYDSTLQVLLQDSISNATQIADIKEKMIDAQNIVDDQEEEETEDRIHPDEATLNFLRNNIITVHKITLDLRIFTSGTQDVDAAGINCKILSTSSDPNVDLAIIQTQDQGLPDPSIRLPKFSRIEHIGNDSLLPQMSERLVMIGYNRGTALSNTNEGLKSQLTEGKISQNTDEFKLLYTIPTLAGSSGSPVLDEKGRLVSVNFAGLSETQSFNYGIHPKKIRQFLERNHIAM